MVAFIVGLWRRESKRFEWVSAGKKNHAEINWDLSHSQFFERERAYTKNFQKKLSSVYP